MKGLNQLNQLMSQIETNKTLTSRNTTPKNPSTLTQRTNPPKTKEEQVEQLVKQQTAEFKIEIEKRFAKSKHNHDFIFPLENDQSTSSSCSSLENCGVYTLNDQNNLFTMRKKSLSEKLIRVQEDEKNCIQKEQLKHNQSNHQKSERENQKSTLNRLEERVKTQIKSNNQNADSSIDSCKLKGLLNKSMNTSNNTILLKLLQKNGIVNSFCNTKPLKQIKSPGQQNNQSSYFTKKNVTMNSNNSFQSTKPNKIDNFKLYNLQSRDSSKIGNTSNNSFYQQSQRNPNKTETSISRNTSVYQKPSNKSQQILNHSILNTSNNLNTSSNRSNIEDILKLKNKNEQNSSRQLSLVKVNGGFYQKPLKESTNIVSPSVNNIYKKLQTETSNKQHLDIGKYIHIDNYLNSTKQRSNVKDNNSTQDKIKDHFIKIGSITGGVNSLIQQNSVIEK